MKPVRLTIHDTIKHFEAIEWLEARGYRKVELVEFKPDTVEKIFSFDVAAVKNGTQVLVDFHFPENQGADAMMFKLMMG